MVSPELWVLTKLASSHPHGAENFEVTSEYVEKLWTPDINAGI
jgi:hypothetical protein